MFNGLIPLGDTLSDWLVCRDADGQPVAPDAAPKFTVFGPSGILATAGGTSALAQSATNITGATNASPIVVTVNAAHNLANGARVTISGVAGNTAANGTFVITTTAGATTFSLNGSTGSGSWTSGGTWALTGHYIASVVCSGGNGFEAGEQFTILHNWLVSGSARSETHTVGVT